jgi:hypothetical protein
MSPVRRLGLAIVAIVFLADQALKLWLLFGVRLAETGPFAVTPFMDIVLAWNRGISYGLFQQDGMIGRWFLVVVSFVAAIWLWRWMWRADGPPDGGEPCADHRRRAWKRRRSRGLWGGRRLRAPLLRHLQLVHLQHR